MVGQCLRLHTPNAAGLGSIPGQGTRSHLLQLKIPHAPTRTQQSQIREFFFLINCSELISQGFLLHFHHLQETWVVWERLFWRNTRNAEERWMCSLMTAWRSSHSSPNKKQKHTGLAPQVPCLADLSDYLAQTMKETSTIRNLLELPSSPPGQTRGPSLRQAPPPHI